MRHGRLLAVLLIAALLMGMVWTGICAAENKCMKCDGSKRCHVCSGSGKNNSDNDCSICSGSGRCYYCAGTGKSS